LWMLREVGNNQLEFINNRYNLCLKSEGVGENVAVSDCDDSPQTIWTVIPVEKPETAPGYTGNAATRARADATNEEGVEPKYVDTSSTSPEPSGATEVTYVTDSSVTTEAPTTVRVHKSD